MRTPDRFRFIGVSCTGQTIMLLYIDVYLYLHKIYYTIEKYTIDYTACLDCEAYGLKEHGLTRSDCMLYYATYIVPLFYFGLRATPPPS